MAYVTSTTGDAGSAAWHKSRRRVLISGAPNSGKTTSLGTWDKPLHIVSVPGELGMASLPLGDDIVTHTFEPGPVPAWGKDWQETTELCQQIAAGKYGECATLAIDGIHKLYQWGMAVVTNGVYKAVQGDFEAKRFGNGWNLFEQFLHTVFALNVPNVVMTCWIGLDKDDPDDRSKDAVRGLNPDLPGQAAQKILGEFSVALVSFVEGTGAARRYYWATQPQGKIRGAGIKAPLDVAKKIPPRVPQDWQALKGMLGV